MPKTLYAAIFLGTLAASPVLAQTGTGTGTTMGTTTNQNNDDGFNLGWLGLLGLAGLAGLSGRKKHDTTVGRH